MQRLPVRITMDAADLAKYPLRLGLSMKAEVDTADTSGESLAKVSPSGAVYETGVYSEDEKKAEQRIREIIVTNLSVKQGQVK
ncbi:MAG: hypothetical protein WDM70_03300 [Nitrosomonadales bacterium]